ncbi:hypothetical protein HN51_016428 [Arachis hypogaea]|nr:uncharacterized protein LOC112696974 isoform X2 [Arachis hypogaea]
MAASSKIRVHSDSMEPLRVPYNLRSHHRVANYSDSTSRRPKRGKVSTGSIVLEDPHGKQERIPNSERSARRNAPEHPRSKGKKVFKCSHQSKKLEDVFPYPLVAMQHYNKNRKEKEQYKVSQRCEDMCFYIRKIGFIRLLHFKAQPILGNSPTRHFYALVHQKPNRDTHVSYCEPHPDPPKSGGPSVAKIVPLCCNICNLGSAEEIKAKSRELRKKSEARKLAGGEDSDSDYYDGYSDPNSGSKNAFCSGYSNRNSTSEPSLLYAPGRTFGGKWFKD